jgi:hypothetical protein
LVPVSARAEESAPVLENPPKAQEWVGVELMLGSLGLGSNVRGTPERVQYGAGGTIRLLRRRWTTFYVTPLEAGFYVTPEHRTTFLHAMVEAGYVAPGPGAADPGGNLRRLLQPRRGRRAPRAGGALSLRRSAPLDARGVSAGRTSSPRAQWRMVRALRGPRRNGRGGARCWVRVAPLTR